MHYGVRSTRYVATWYGRFRTPHERRSALSCFARWAYVVRRIWYHVHRIAGNPSVPARPHSCAAHPRASRTSATSPRSRRRSPGASAGAGTTRTRARTAARRPRRPQTAARVGGKAEHRLERDEHPRGDEAIERRGRGGPARPRPCAPRGRHGDCTHEPLQDPQRRRSIGPERLTDRVQREQHEDRGDQDLRGERRVAGTSLTSSAPASRRPCAPRPRPHRWAASARPATRACRSRSRSRRSRQAIVRAAAAGSLTETALTAGGRASQARIVAP